MGPLKKKKQKATLKPSHRMPQHSGETGYWFIPEALIRKTGSQHKVFPLLYSNEGEFALWCAALILATKKREKWDFQIKLTQAMEHHGTGRLSLRGSCSIRAPQLGMAGGGSTESRRSVTPLWNTPQCCLIGPGPLSSSIIQRVVVPWILVVQWPHIHIAVAPFFLLLFFIKTKALSFSCQQRG